MKLALCSGLASIASSDKVGVLPLPREVSHFANLPVPISISGRRDALMSRPRTQNVGMNKSYDNSHNQKSWSD